MQQTIDRLSLRQAVFQGLEEVPVVALLGARQVGKTTLAEQIAAEWHGPVTFFDLETAATHPRYGASWEGFALEQILLAHGGRDAYFYATARGAELDLLLLRKGRRWGFEFKCTDAPRTSKSMHVVLRDLELSHLWVVYPGDYRYPLTDCISAMPLKDITNIAFRDPSS